jgi:hypothetical protein
MIEAANDRCASTDSELIFLSKFGEGVKRGSGFEQPITPSNHYTTPQSARGQR